VPTATPTTAKPDPTPTRKPTDTSSSATSSGPSATSVLRLVVVLLLLAGLCVPALLRRAQRRRRFARVGDARLEMENLWRELRATASDLQTAWPDGRSPRTAARIICHRISAGPDDADALRRFVTVLEQARYRDRFDLDDSTRDECRQTVTSWIRVLADAAGPRRARLARFLPRSVLDPRRRVEVAAPVATQPEASNVTEVG